MLEKIACLQKQLSKIFPRENQVQTEVDNNVPDLEDAQSTDEDQKNILDEALSVHDSSDENEDSEDKPKATDTTFVVESSEQESNKIVRVQHKLFSVI